MTVGKYGNINVFKSYSKLLGVFAKGICYYWTWLPVKLGYGKYDEGMAIFSNSVS